MHKFNHNLISQSEKHAKRSTFKSGPFPFGGPKSNCCFVNSQVSFVLLPHCTDVENLHPDTTDFNFDNF